MFTVGSETDGPDPTRTIPGPNTPANVSRSIWNGGLRSRGVTGGSVVVRQRHRRTLAHAAGDTDLAGANRCPKWVRNTFADPGVPLTPAATP